MINSLNSSLNTGAKSTLSSMNNVLSMNNIKNNKVIKKIAAAMSTATFKSLALQIESMAELDNSCHLGKVLNVVV